jgi:hypothetical protein
VVPCSLCISPHPTPFTLLLTAGTGDAWGGGGARDRFDSTQNQSGGGGLPIPRRASASMVEPKTRPLAEKLGALLEILFRQLFAFELREQTRATASMEAQAPEGAVEEASKADGDGEC